VAAAQLCDFREKGRVESCQHRIYIGSVSTVFPGTLGRGDVDPVKGEYPLEFSLDRIFPSLVLCYIQDAGLVRNAEKFNFHVCLDRNRYKEIGSMCGFGM